MGLKKSYLHDLYNLHTIEENYDFYMKYTIDTIDMISCRIYISMIDSIDNTISISTMIFDDDLSLWLPRIGHIGKVEYREGIVLDTKELVNTSLGLRNSDNQNLTLINCIIKNES